MKKLTLFAILMIGLFLPGILLPSPLQTRASAYVNRDSVKDGFEDIGVQPSGNNYTVNTENPGGWNFSSTCTSVGLVSGVSGSVSPYAGKLMYQITGSGCSLEHGEIYEPVIALGATISLTVEAQVQLGSPNYLACPIVVPTVPAAYFALGCSSLTTWNTLNYSLPTVAGHIYYLVLQCYGTTGAGECDFDNVYATSAALYNHPINFKMIDYGSNQYYDIAGFYGFTSSTDADFSLNGYLTINYSGSTPQYRVLNVTAPDLNLPYSNNTSHLANSASLITVKMNAGDGYYRTIIPTSNNVTMYLDPPSLAYPYTAEVTDVFNGNIPGSQIYFYLGSNVITSGYLDASSNFGMWLVPAQYNVRIYNSTGNGQEYSGLVTVPSPTNIGATTPVPITITNTTSSTPSSIFTDISTGINANTTSGYIYASFSDASFHTNMVNITLTNTNITGTTNDGTLCFSVFAHGACTVVSANSTGFLIIGGHLGIVTGSFTYNPSLEGQYWISYTFNSTQFGINTLGAFAVTGGGIFVQRPTLGYNCILGWCVVLTVDYNNNYNVVLNFVAIFFIVALAGAFGPRYAAFGTFVVDACLWVFASAGWIPLASVGGVTLLTFISILAVINYMKGREAREVFT